MISPGLLLLSAGLLCAAAASPIGSDRECSCARGQVDNVWCVPCKIGYVATVEIRSYVLFDALDAHGHDVDPEGMRCAACRWAVKRDAFCGDCRVGYVNGQAYFSKLTYLLAQGQPLDAGALTCTACRTHAGEKTLPLETGGWCDACAVGIVGNRAYRDRRTFKKARREYERLLRAVERSAECELCAAAIIYDRRCHRCEISYRDGKPQVPDEPATGTSPTRPGPSESP